MAVVTLVPWLWSHLYHNCGTTVTTGQSVDPIVLTVLIHLGYLSYDWNNKECFIPNSEVSKEMANAVKSKKWKVAESLYICRHRVTSKNRC